MAIIDYTIERHAAVMTLNSGENRFNPTFLEALLNALDDIERKTEAATLVVTGAHEKIFCNGIDLEWFNGVLRQQDLRSAKRFFYQLNRVFKRLVTYPLVTVAAISGHAFAGGAILSCAFDFRFMRSDLGFFCLPEVDLGIPFLPGMNALLRKAVPFHVLEQMQLTGMRLTADRCEAHHIIQKACPLDTLMDATLDFALDINKKRPVVAELKARLHQAIVHALDVEDVAYIESGVFNLT